MSLKLLVIDDHPLVLKGITAALQTLGQDTRVLTAGDGEEGMNLANENPDLDLVLLDLALPGGCSGYGLISRLHERMPSLPVIVVSALDEPENIRLAINAGAMGFVPKSAGSNVLIDALKDVLEGNISVPESAQQGSDEPDEPLRTPPDASQLTPRQLEVLTGVCHGKTNKEVATDLGLSEKTIKAHVTAIFKVLGVVNRTQAALIARRLGMMPN
jgi:two-component system, NarL family, nitrate/nitrite response regulator NarL